MGSKRIVPQRRFVAIQRKVRDDLHDSAVQWTVGTFKIALSPSLLSRNSEIFSIKTSDCVKLYHFKTNERCHTLEELSSGNLLVILHELES